MASKETMARFDKWYERFSAEANALAKKDSLSMSALRTKGQDIYLDVLEIRNKCDKEIKGWEQERANYTQTYLNTKILEVRKKYDVEIKKIADTFVEAVNNTLANKQKKANLMLATAPTREQLNLLESLRIRKNDITANEFQSIAYSLLDNYQAFLALRTMASEVGIFIHQPKQYDYDAIVESIKWTRDYLNERINDLLTPWNKMHPFGRLFFGTGWDDNWYHQYAVDVLDGIEQMSTPEDIRIERVITDTEKATIDHLLSGVSGDELEARVKELAKESDNMKSMLLLHPTYSVFLAEDPTPTSGE